MTSTEQPGFLVHVAHRAEITAKDLKVCVLPDIVFRHFEHAEVKVCDWAEGATCDKDYWSFVGVLECLREASMGKDVIRGACEGLCEMGGGSHGWRRGRGRRKEEDSVTNVLNRLARHYLSGVNYFPTLISDFRNSEPLAHEQESYHKCSVDHLLSRARGPRFFLWSPIADINPVYLYSLTTEENFQNIFFGGANRYKERSS